MSQGDTGPTEAIRALPWPPTPYSAASDWCPNCDFPLDRTEHHGRCLGYIVGTDDMALCFCPCTEDRHVAAAMRQPDAFYDRPRWWQDLAPNHIHESWKQRSW
ncbi:hypothetical protein [Streptacidiphilus rugosus]|uniref:hypothetical protein n=1 Tax=Streptacidiphilus rugosus TaxID=405783 RepID=UPI0012F9CE94|nr:hypothetical protein [Streptacidiphilus rugosus]